MGDSPLFHSGASASVRSFQPPGSSSTPPPSRSLRSQIAASVIPSIIPSAECFAPARIPVHPPSTDAPSQSPLSFSSSSFPTDVEKLPNIPAPAPPLVLSLPGSSTFRSLALPKPPVVPTASSLANPSVLQHIKGLALPSLVPALPASTSPPPSAPTPSPLSLTRRLVGLINSDSTPLLSPSPESPAVSQSPSLKRVMSPREAPASKRLCTPETRDSFISNCSQDSMDSSTLETCLIEYDAQSPPSQAVFVGPALVRQAKVSVEALLARPFEDSVIAEVVSRDAAATSAPQSPTLRFIDVVERELLREQSQSLLRGLDALRSCAPRDGVCDAAAQSEVVSHLLAELQVVATRIQQFARGISVGTSPTSEPFVRVCYCYRTLIVTLFVLVSRVHLSMRLLNKPSFTKPRNWIMSVFFGAFFCPILREGAPDVLMLCKMGLAQMDSKHRKVPREVVEAVLRPALIQFCEIKNLSTRLVLGLHSVVELFPCLFRHVFGVKILRTLAVFTNKAQLRKELPGISDSAVVRLLVLLLDLFRVFATSQTSSSPVWIVELCETVIKLSKVWCPMTQESCDPICSGPAACSGFLTPVCRILSRNAPEAVDVFLAKSSDPEFSAFFGRLTSCRHASALARELRSRSVAVCGQSVSFEAMRGCLTDVSLVVRGGEELRAHRVVLASRSPYLARVLRHQKGSVSLQDHPAQSVAVVLDYMYSDTVALGAHLDWTQLVQLAQLLELTGLEALVEDHLCSSVTPDSALSLARLAVAWPDVHQPPALPRELRADRCGTAGGERLLRACQRLVLANLGSMSHSLECDSLTSSLLSHDSCEASCAPSL